LARELRHDPFDATYLAGALEYQASGIMTTDTDFRRLCRAKKLDYVNPVPTRILEKFAGWKSGVFGADPGRIKPFREEDRAGT
jgi:hypothetical protein